MKDLISNSYKALRCAAWGAAGGAIGSVISEFIFDRKPRSFMMLMGNTGLWFGIMGACIAVAILMGYSHYLRRVVQLKESIKGGLLFGFLGGFVAGAIAQGAYAGIGPTEILRVICWGVAGGLLGTALSFRIPNLDRKHGFLGGMLGGGIGGGLFVLFSAMAGEVLGRLFGVAAIGFFIGLMIMVAESLFREAWLDVNYGPGESRTVSLGREPVSVGSDSTACTVYVRNVAPTAYRFTLHDNQILSEDVPTGRVERLLPGDKRAVGNVNITVRVSGSSSVGTTSRVPTSQTGRLSLYVQGRSIPLGDSATLRSAEIPGLESRSADGKVAEVTRHPQDNYTIGLKNLSTKPWKATLPDSGHRTVDVGQSIKLVVGTRIKFGSVEGEVRG